MRGRKKEWLLTLVSVAMTLLAVAMTLLAVEMAGHYFVQPSDRAYGTLLGVELPPIRIVSGRPPWETPRDHWYHSLVVNGRHITTGDIFGYYRYDPLLGYAPLESTRSVNGWWESNDIGARSREPSAAPILPGHKRLLVLGDSFAQGSGLQQERTWAGRLQAVLGDTDVVNLAVDGYSMGQAYLRYELLRDRVDHDIVVMMFVPGADLWREVNTIRDLGEPWNVNIVMPRYVLDQGRLRLVRSPYAWPTDVYLDNASEMSLRLRDHLRRYDRFYFRSLYESPPLLGQLVTYKICAAAWGAMAHHRTLNGVMASNSEAMAVTEAIFATASREVVHAGRTFWLVILPIRWNLDSYGRGQRYWQRWQQMVAEVCSGVQNCLDLAPALRDAPVGAVDIAYDGSHYGPSANEVIAHAIATALHDEVATRPAVSGEGPVRPTVRATTQTGGRARSSRHAGG